MSARTAPTMRAGVIAGPGSVRTEEVPTPQPGPADVLVRLEGCGICGSNLPVWEGRPWFTYPLEPGAPGHEGWGVVERCGTEVEDLAPGDRVAILSERSFAEMEVTPAANAVRLPAALDDTAFPGEPFACAMNVFARSGIQAGDTVAVVGVGFLGAVITRLAADAGARVIAVSRREFALDVARRLGAEWTFSVVDPSAVVSHVADLTDGAMCDRVVEATGVQEPLDLASELTRIRGRLVIAGYHQDGLRTVDIQQWNWRGIDVVNAHERDPRVYVDGLRAAVAAVVSGTIDPATLITHRYPFDRLGDALEALRTRPDGFLKAVVTL